MDKYLYDKCVELTVSYNGVNPFWKQLADDNGFENAEALRSSFRRERTRRQDDPEQKRIMQHSKNIVLFDIETLPIKSYVWDVWNQNINPVQIIDDWVVLSWSAKNLMREEVRSQILTPKEARRRDDSRIIQDLWQEMNNAAVLIGHNVLDFDIPRANTRFLYHGLTPPSPYRVIDTLKIIKHNFSMTFNKLGYVAQYLQLENKKMSNSGFELWKRCADGDEDALDEMETYNKQDTLSLEDLYLAVRPWDKYHPNLGLYFEDATTRCKCCGCESLTNLDNPYQTAVGLYQALRCTNCGAIGRRAENLVPKETRKIILR